MQVASVTGQPVQLVRQYDLFFDIDFTGLSFTGKVTVDLDTTGDISLDAVGLQVKSVKHGNRNLQYKQTSNAVEIKTGKFSGPLDIEFNGKVSENFTGFYKASYGDGYILTTHLEAVQARKLFPCLDHPAFKAVFKLVVLTGPDLKVISNMPVESEEVRANKKVVSFKQTPKMSTYLFYLGVGKFVEEHNRHGQTHLYAAHARPKGSIKTEFSFEAAQKVLDYYESYFGIPYQLPKLHQVAVPEFAYGAMENWGAITYREILMHVEQNTSVRAKKAVAGVIAHACAQIWFGDLVTMKWWDDIWLNESFATFMSVLAQVEATRFKTGCVTFANQYKTAARRQDQLPTTHPVAADIPDIESVYLNFDAITYNKGACVLRQLVAYVGQDTFLRGVQRYVKQRQYANATLADFLSDVEAGSGRDLKAWSKVW